MSEAWVISDVHLGGGFEQDPLEDFRADVALVGFIDELSSGSTLVLNGDIIEFVQAPPLPGLSYFDGLPSDLLWSADVSVPKVRNVVAAHGQVFDALGRLISDRGGRVVMTIGNHDLDVVFPDVQHEIRLAMGKPAPGELDFVVGRWQYDDVVIQHGHQATPENCPRDPDHFVHPYERQGQIDDYLERVWGTDFLLQWYNDFELTHPYADNVKPTASALYGAITARPRLAGLRDLLRLLVFVKRRGLPPGTLGAILAGEPDVDSATVIGNVESDVWQTLLLDTNPEELSAAVASLPREDQAVLAAAGTAELPDPEPLDEPDEGEVLGLVRGPRETRAAEAILSQPGVEGVVFGHTHKVVDGALGNRLYNPGCWIPHLDLTDPAVKQRVSEIGFCEEVVRDGSLYSSRYRALRVRASQARSQLELVTIHEG